MSTQITIDDRGCVTVDIAATKDGAEGEVFSYAATVTADDDALFACLLRRTDSDEPYRVTKPKGHAWNCSCADRTYRGHKKRGVEHCKHILSAMGLRALFALHPSHQRQPQGVAS